MKAVKTALVLSAGGMWGAYQAGAWKALESRMRPDMVVGVSAGALNGWAIAGGVSGAELVERWLDPRTARLIRARLPRFPWQGFFDPAPLEEMAGDLVSRYSPKVPFGGAVVEVPALRPRLIRGEEITSRHLLAICAIPIAFPPVRLNGQLCVDGGLLSALPLWAATQMGATHAVALDVLPRMPSAVLRAGVSLVRRIASPLPPTGALEVLRVSTGRPLGPLRSAMRWNLPDIREWIRLGEQDGLKLELCRHTGSTV
jgi:NTE family protein